MSESFNICCLFTSTRLSVNLYERSFMKPWNTEPTKEGRPPKWTCEFPLVGISILWSDKSQNRPWVSLGYTTIDLEVQKTTI